MITIFLLLAAALPLTAFSKLLIFNIEVFNYCPAPETFPFAALFDFNIGTVGLDLLLLRELAEDEFLFKFNPALIAVP